MYNERERQGADRRVRRTALILLLATAAAVIAGVGAPRAEAHPWLAGSDITSDVYSVDSAATGDMDRDGTIDIVTANWGQTNRLYLNNGTASPFAGISGSNITADAGNSSGIAVGDIDRDGDLDVVVSNHNQRARWYLNNGTSAPLSGVTGNDMGTDTGGAHFIALGDVDGDGDLDAVKFCGLNNSSMLYRNNGTAAPFAAVGDQGLPDPSLNTAGGTLADMDNDGDLDLLYANGGSANRLYLNNGSGSFAAGANISNDAHNTQYLAVADMDGDGDLDVVVGNYSGAVNRLYVNSGSAAPFSGVTGDNISDDAHGTMSIALADVNADGSIDVVAGNPGGVNRLYLNNGSSAPFAGVSGTNVTDDAHNTAAVLLAAFDPDADLDLVAANNGSPSRLYLNGHIPPTPTWTPTFTPTQFPSVTPTPQPIPALDGSGALVLLAAASLILLRRARR